MLSPRDIVFAFIAPLLLLGTAGDHTAPPATLGLDEQDACALLTPAEVSKALEVTSRAGQRLIAASPKACWWSDIDKSDMSNRRVALSLMQVAGFNVGKSSSRIVTETVTGIGDEAYYELPKGASPFLFVRKGNNAFSVRVLNGLKFKAFTLEQEKAKEADLAKAAVARL